MTSAMSFNRRVTAEAQPGEDADIYLRIAEQDPVALKLAFDRYGGLAYLLALRTIGDAGRAEEVVQDVFLTLWKSPQSFDPSRGTFRTWMVTLVRNRSIDSMRTAWQRQRGEAMLPLDLTDTAPASDPAAMVEAKVERALVRDALDSLPREQRVIIDLACSGYSHSEMADRLRIPLGTVKGRMRLGMKKLRTFLMVTE